MKGSELNMYKRLELRMFWVHSNSVEPKVQHGLCHCYAALNIFIKIFIIISYRFHIICTQKLHIKCMPNMCISYERSPFLHINTTSFCFYLAYYLYVFSWDLAQISTYMVLYKTQLQLWLLLRLTNIICWFILALQRSLFHARPICYKM